MRKYILFYLALAIPCLCIAKDYNYYRLPNTVKPLTYNLTILSHLEENRYEGSVLIRLVVLNNTRQIIFHAVNFTIDESQVQLKNLNSSETILIKKLQFLPRYEYCVLSLPKVLMSSEYYELFLVFSGQMRNDTKGFYAGTYEDEKSNSTRYLASTHFTPIEARTMFPCFDEPHLKAKFTLKLGHHIRFYSLSNMPMERTILHETLEDYVWFEFQESVLMAPHLVAFTISDFYTTNLVITTSGAEFRTWARPDDAAMIQIKYANEVGIRILHFFENIFNISYPLPKLDQVVMPLIKGSKGNWGIIGYEESQLFYSQDFGVANKNAIALTVAHEIAQQWFGNLVTLNSWSDAWLHNSFASYLSGWGLNFAEKKRKILEQRTVNNFIQMFEYDAYNNSKPISRQMTEVDDIRRSFDDFAYKKSVLLLRMFHHFIGNVSFLIGLRSYLNKYSYNTSNKEDLWNSFNVAAQEIGVLPSYYNLDTVMESWISQPGYPVINVTRDYESGMAIVTQKRFLVNNQTDDIERCYWIPLSYTTSEISNFERTTPRHWLKCPNNLEHPMTIRISTSADNWIIFNLQMSAYYKVNYDRNNWNLIINALNGRNCTDIHALNRAQLIEDSFMLAWNGDLSYDIALRLAYYLRREHEYAPWSLAINNFKRIGLVLRHLPEYEDFQWYIQQVTTPVFKYFGGLDSNFKEITLLQGVIKVRIATWACFHDVPDCVLQSKALFSNWEDTARPDEMNPVPRKLRELVYCTAIRHGNEFDWDFLWERYTKSKDEKERLLILSALVCTKELSLLNRLIQRVEHGARINEEMAFLNIMSQETGFIVAKQQLLYILNQKYNLTSTETSLVNRMIMNLGWFIASTEDMNKFKKVLDGTKNEVYLKFLQQISSNIEWSHRNAKYVAAVCRNIKAWRQKRVGN